MSKPFKTAELMRLLTSCHTYVSSRPYTTASPAEAANRGTQGLDTELGQRHYSDDAVTIDMLVKRAQNWDESEMMWRGKHAANDDDDDEEDPRSDSELYDHLLASLAAQPTSPGSRTDPCDWTGIASREELPDPRPDEDVVLSADYDAKKAEEEERKNQFEVAKFSGGGMVSFS